MSEKETTFEYRKLERQGFCRDCDGIIDRGEMAISGWSHRNKGMHMIFHPRCIEKIKNLLHTQETIGN